MGSNVQVPGPPAATRSDSVLLLIAGKSSASKSTANASDISPYVRVHLQRARLRAIPGASPWNSNSFWDCDKCGFLPLLCFADQPRGYMEGWREGGKWS